MRIFEEKFPPLDLNRIWIEQGLIKKSKINAR